MANDPRRGKNTFRNKNVKTKESAPKKQSSKWKNKLKYWAIKITLYFFAISIGLVVLYKFVPIPMTSTMIARKMEAIADGRDSEIFYDWVSYSNISKEAPLAVVAAEDQLFPDHNGFDFEAMGNAFSKNLKGKNCVVQAHSHNKLPKTYSFGSQEVTSGKYSKFTSLF